MKAVLLATIACTALMSTAAQAVIVTTPDPQIWFGPPGTTGPLGGTAKGGESNLLGTTGDFAFGAQLGKGKALQSPTLILIASTTSAAVTLSSSLCGGACAVAATGAGSYGLTANSKTMSSGTIYSNVGLGAGGSNSFGNYQTADNLNGFGKPTEYFITVFDVPVSEQPKTAYAAMESGAGAGSFIAGYSCEVGATSSDPCSPNGSRGQTPFTNAGLLGPTGGGGGGSVPEPAALSLLGVGLVGLGLARRRRV